LARFSSSRINSAAARSAAASAFLSTGFLIFVFAFFKIRNRVEVFGFFLKKLKFKNCIYD